MEFWCIFCSQLPERLDFAEKQFAAHGLAVNYWQSVHAKSFGVTGAPWPPTWMVGEPHSVNAGYVGLAIGYWTLWQHLLLIDRPGPFLVFEDDVILSEGFREKFSSFYERLPGDWKIVLVGSLWEGKNGAPPRVVENIHEIGDGNMWGTHAVLYRKSAMRFLMEANHRAELPIDAQLNKTSYRALKTYAFIPSLAQQRSCLPADDPRRSPCSCG